MVAEDTVVAKAVEVPMVAMADMLEEGAGGVDGEGGDDDRQAAGA